MFKFRSTPLLGALAGLGLAGALSTSAHAALLAHDGFQIGAGGYTAGTNIVGQNPSTLGFTGAWASSTSVLYQPNVQDLDYQVNGENQDSKGGSLQINIPNNNIRNVNRSLSYNVASTASGFYVSSLMSFPAGTGIALAGVHDTNSDLPADTFGLRWGVNNGKIVLRARDDQNPFPQSEYVIENSYNANKTYLFVLRAEINYTGGFTDRISVWINPTDLHSELNNTPDIVITASLDQTTGNRAVDQLRLYTDNFTSGSTFKFDEFRLGTTWQDVVVPVPEPMTASMSVMGFAALGGMAMRRRR